MVAQALETPITPIDTPAQPTKVVPLSSLRPGEHGTICAMDGSCDPAICHRLQLLGFGTGRTISKTRQAPMGGPMVFQVCHVNMCLRRAQADMIMVEVDSDQTCDLT